MRLKMLRGLLILAVIPLCAAASLIAQDADTDARFALPLQLAGTHLGRRVPRQARVSASRFTSRTGQRTSRLKILPIRCAKTVLTRW